MSQTSKILLVDDDPDVRLLVERALARQGYNVVSVESATLAMLEISRTHFDLVLTDIRMPGMDGLELTQWIKHQSPETEVILMTSFGSLDHAVDAFHLGAFDLLIKPFKNYDLFITSVRRALEKQRRMEDQLFKAIIEAQEAERERICMDIHDGVAQTLSSAFHYLQTLDGSELPQTLQANVHKASALMRDAIREAREIIASLRPGTLDVLGLVATLREELHEIRTRSNWVVDFDAEAVRLPKTVETTLYRIIHEAVNNIIKHAQATRVAIRLKTQQRRAFVEIQDNGQGFDPATMPPTRRDRVGLFSMRKRAELLHGSFDVQSARGQGTLVRIEVPLLDPDGATPIKRHSEFIIPHS